MALADVVILNNVWEWFVPTAEGRVTMWQFVRQHLKPGALLVTVPDLETSLRKLGVFWNHFYFKNFMKDSRFSLFLFIKKHAESKLRSLVGDF